MATCKKHAGHTHQHGPDCGHTAIRRGNKTEYLHDGHLHSPHGDHVDEDVIEVSSKNPDGCHPIKVGEAGHKHGQGCGHEPVPHGDHTDYLVEGHLHHPHGDHCDDHGPIEVAR